MVVANSLFNKPCEKHITHRATTCIDFKPPWDQEGYNSIDHILINLPWRNGFADIESNIGEAALCSDHAPLIAKLIIKLKNKKRNANKEDKQYFKPDDEQTKCYNELFKDKIEGYIGLQVKLSASLLAQILNETAEQTLTQKHNSIKKDFITRHIWELMEKRENLKSQNEHNEASLLNEEIRTEIKKDKHNEKLEKLEERDDKRMYKWDQIKTFKNNCTPNFANFKYDQGNRIPFTNKAVAAAACFRNEAMEQNQ